MYLQIYVHDAEETLVPIPRACPGKANRGGMSRGAEGRGSLVQSPSQHTASLIYITSSRGGLGGVRTAWLPPLPALLSRAERQASGCGMDRGQDWHVSVFILLSFSFFFNFSDA